MRMESHGADNTICYVSGFPQTNKIWENQGKMYIKFQAWTNQGISSYCCNVLHLLHQILGRDVRDCLRASLLYWVGVD